MFRYGKTTQSAIAAMSRLAQIYHDRTSHDSSDGIARARRLSRPLVAKLLTILAQGGLVTGSRGPGGGYRLARPPHRITLLDVVRLFEREDEASCPFGPGWCGCRKPCPLHKDLTRLRNDMFRFLARTDFGVFVNGPPRSRRARPAGRGKRPERKSA